MPKPAAPGSDLTRNYQIGEDGKRRPEPLTAAGVNFWAVFTSAPDSYLLLAPDSPRFTMVAANEARLRATMTLREDVVGHPLFEVFPDNPEDPEASGVRNLRASLEEVLRTGKPHMMALQKYDIRRPDGTFEERYWEPLNSPVFDEQGTLIYIIHRVEDVTEQVRTGLRLKNVEEILARLRESEDRYRLLVDMIPQNIWTTDAKGHHTYFSRRWYEFTDAAPEDSHGEGWVQFIHPDDKARMLARWQHSLDTGEPYEIEYRFRSGHGEYRWFLGKALPLRNEAGEIIEWFGTATDITDRKRHDEERERLLQSERDARAEAERQHEELERVTESRTRLMRGFSHDVKNPLGAADGYATLLEDGIGGPLTDAQRQSVQRIRRSLQTSLRLIGDLLELARAEAGQIELHMQPVDVAALVREVADDFRGQIEAEELALEVRAGTPLPAESDPTRVRQILANLVSNAAKYTERGRITLDACRQRRPEVPGSGEWAVIEVSDTGGGIPPEKRERIFQEFTRLDPNAAHGAGVGLAISRRIAHLLGGDLTVASEVGRGSTFTLWLPCKPEERRRGDRRAART